MEKCENSGCTERFLNFQEQLKVLQQQTTQIKTKFDENENGRMIDRVQVMFDNAAMNTSNENNRRDGEKIRADEKQEKATEKQSQIIADIGKDVNRFNAKIDNLEAKVNLLEVKVDRHQVEQVVISDKVVAGELKTMVDTSLLTKWLLRAASTVVIGAVVTYFLKYVFRIF